MALVSDVVAGFVSESTNSLLKAAIRRIRQEINLAWEFRDDLRGLERKLKRLNAILCGVQTGFASNNELLDDWVKQIREVAYQAEDVIDDYSYELLKRRIALRTRPQRFRRFRRITTKIRFFCSPSSNQAVFRQQMAHKIKSLKERIDEIYADAREQGIKPVKVAGGRSYASSDDQHDHTATAMSMQRQTPYNEVLIKRKGAEDDIVRCLRQASDSNKHLSFVGICGMAGVGKTTICDSIFNTMEIKERFEERIWISVSHDFDFTQLLNRMIEQIGDEQSSNTNDCRTAKDRLEKKMEGKKFLLVLDDIWGTFAQYGNALRGNLQNVGALKGNTILATSRLKDTLEKLDATHILPLEKLSKEDSQSLFKQCVGENNLSDPTKADLGWKMLSKCEGVPLAIKALGGLLKSQNSTSQWRKIEQDGNIWNKVDDILPSVKLSFKYLPSLAAKRCFAYCAIFKEDEVIGKDRLIQLWMAQGLLQSYDEKEQLCDEPLGEHYLCILLNYSLFQEARFDDLGNIRSCKMHDVVHSLALNISKGDAEITEHRSLHLEEGWSRKLSNGSIAYFDVTRKEEFITRTTCLRVLSLVRVGLEELPDLIGELKHLRYLDISKNNIKFLPNGLGKLYHLQTLRIFFNSTQDGGYRMPMLPKGFTKLANLRHLCSDIIMPIPVDLGMLTSLQTLPVIDLDEHSWGGRASELGNLHNLTGALKLTGFGDEGIIEELKKVKLGTKEKIEKLALRFHSNSNRNEEDVNHVMMLEALQPHSSLAALEISWYKSKAMPKWMMEMIGHQDAPLQNLVSLSIMGCPFLEQLPSMKNLSALKVLKISFCDRATSLQNLEYLTSLQTLQLYGCSRMENLPDIRSLVSLEVLGIDMCRKMSCLPAGLSNLPNLKTLKICDLSPNVNCFPFPDLNHLSPLSASLRELLIQAYGMDKVENLPNQIQHLRQLRSLNIDRFINLEELPEWLGKLTSLERLGLTDLPLVEHLPSQAAMECLSQLTSLNVGFCPLLRKACRTPNGSEWAKIQKIHDVRFWPPSEEEAAEAINAV